MAGVVRWGVAAILSALCLMYGFAPDAWIVDVLNNPPEVLYSPWPRLGVIVVGLLIVLGMVVWEIRRHRKVAASKEELETARIEAEARKIKAEQMRDKERRPERERELEEARKPRPRPDMRFFEAMDYLCAESKWRKTHTEADTIGMFAAQEIWKAITGNEIAAWAYNHHGNLVRLSTSELAIAELKPRVHLGEPNTVEVSVRHGMAMTDYTRLTVSRSEVESYWP